MSIINRIAVLVDDVQVFFVVSLTSILLFDPPNEIQRVRLVRLIAIFKPTFCDSLFVRLQIETAANAVECVSAAKPF